MVFIRDEAYWQQPLAYQAKDVKLLVKHVFITNDLGEDALPKWASWVKVVIDGTSTTTERFVHELTRV